MGRGVRGDGWGMGYRKFSVPRTGQITKEQQVDEGGIRLDLVR